MSLSDVAVLRSKEKPVIIRPYNKPRIIFVEGELIEADECLEYALSFETVIVHNADRPISRKVINACTESGTHLFSTNIRSIQPYVHNIPIGIENLHHRRNGSIHYYFPCNEELTMSTSKKIVPVLVSFSPSSNRRERNRVLSICAKKGLKNKLYDNLVDYRKALIDSMFVISPPGNGIDCHRTWEAIYHKAVPVIERGNYIYSDSIELPIHVCESYEDFLSTECRDLAILYSEITSRFYPSVYSDWWFELIKKTLADLQVVRCK